MAKVIREELVCIDCHLTIEGYKVEEHDVKIQGNWYSIDDNGDNNFSHAPCGLCGTTLGGGRYKVIQLD